MDLQHSASLHESSVQRIAAHEVDLPKRGRAKNRRLVIASTYVKVDDLLLAEIRRILDTTAYTKVEILGPDEVIVR